MTAEKGLRPKYSPAIGRHRERVGRMLAAIAGSPWVVTSEWPAMRAEAEAERKAKEVHTASKVGE
jgi:hypothetical protein